MCGSGAIGTEQLRPWHCITLLQVIQYLQVWFQQKLGVGGQGGGRFAGRPQGSPLPYTASLFLALDTSPRNTAFHAGVIMQVHYYIEISEHPPRADNAV